MTPGETSDRILDVIQSNPGIHKRAVMKETGVGWGTVHYHVRRLAREGIIQVVSTAYETRLFPSGHLRADPEAIRWVTALRNDIGHSIIEELGRAPDLTVKELSRRLEIPDYSVRRYLRHLENDGIVVHETSSDGAIWRPSPGNVPDLLRPGRAEHGQDYRTRL